RPSDRCGSSGEHRRALIEAGDFPAALDALARVDVGPSPPDPILIASSLAARAERLNALEARLLSVVEGCDRPADAEGLAAFARLAFARCQHAAAVRLWAEVVAAPSVLAADIASTNRFQAARGAALASGACRGVRSGLPETRRR